MKNRVLSIILLPLLTLIIAFSINLDKSNNSNNEKIFYANSSAEFLYDYSNPEIIEKESEYIAIISIEKISGVDNINKKTNENCYPYTYGNAKILKVLKGNFDKDIITFARLGGTLEFDKWIKGEDDKEKILKLLEDEDLDNLLVKSKFINDIDIQKGKTYLAYFNKPDNFNEDIDFVIKGFQYGLREINNLTTTKKVNSINNIQVMNNDTQKWETLDKIVNS